MGGEGFCLTRAVVAIEMAPDASGEKALHERRWETSGAAVGIEAGGAIAAVWLLLENSYPTAIYKVVPF